ncbi:polysaccharide deacetylase family protein [Paenibacillus puerhi]|uniref:polysaccharide deacetylase family protein n=1 Tax=Paenibacillus puerhi TaxID=2692622 RepID=UPI00135AB52B|nr:polysaccharide deacetylase family protein [Paenibacillus puerhi]
MTRYIRIGLTCAALVCVITACSDGGNGSGSSGAPIEQPAPAAPTQQRVKPPSEAQVVPSPPVTPVTSGSGNGNSAPDGAGGAGLETTKPVESKEKPAPSPSPDTAAGSVYGATRNPAGAAVGSNATKPQEPGSGDRKQLSWYYMKKSKGQVPGFPGETKTFADSMKALWVGTGKKVYLTIDTGGDLGDIDTLVKALKDNDAKANFFIAGYNVKKNPDFVRQLVKDGHLVANHTMTHTDMNLQTDDQVRKEIKDYEKLYKEVTGQDIQPFFRFPYGRYNKHLLELVSGMGYTSVFWSTAMRDWEPRKNGAEDPYNDIMNNLHDGNIILMHQGSPENIQALDRIVKAIQKAGYTLALLDDIEPPK